MISLFNPASSLVYGISFLKDKTFLSVLKVEEPICFTKARKAALDLSASFAIITGKSRDVAASFSHFVNARKAAFFKSAWLLW